MQRPTLVFAASLLLCLAPLAATAQTVWESVEGDAFTFSRITDRVFHAVGRAEVAAGSNSAVIVSDADVLLVDSHMTPAAARALLDDLPRLTDLPLRYVINTHFHFDHVHGNQVFGPDVEIIAHETTRRRIADGDTRRGRGWDFFIGTIPDRIAALEAELESEDDDAERATLTEQIARLQAFWKLNAEVEPTPPTLALREAVTLYRSGLEIRLLHFGRGHTDGDVVVYLPGDKILVTGDLVTAGLPYMGDAHFADWSSTLAEVAELDVEVIVPGHGGAFTEVERVAHLEAYLTDLWDQARELHRAGLSAEEAARRIDLTAHSEHFPQIEGPGVHPHAAARAWELLDAE